MTDIQTWLLFPVLGAFAGVLAGLLGIGGGLVIVPVLNLLFMGAVPGISPDVRMHLAIGTSLGTIVFTSLSSLYAHHRRQAVVWPAVRGLAPGILAGGLAGAAIADALDTRPLQQTFGLLVVVISLYMLLARPPAAHRGLPGLPGYLGAGTGIGTLAALAGIGGGVMTVPLMLWCSVDLRRAVGTAAATTFPVAVAGAAGFLLVGLSREGLPAAATGYLFWPAVLGISVGSVLTAPLGARLAHTLPVGILKKVFAVFLVAVGVRMAF